MINLENEKASAISATEVNELLAFAIGEAEKDGFINRYVFERAAYVFLYLLLCEGEDEKKEVSDAIDLDGVLVTWTNLVKGGKIEEMIKSHNVEVQLVNDACDHVFKDYFNYSNSIRATFAGFQSSSARAMKETMKQLSDAMSSEQYKDVLDIAEKWGMSNGAGQATALA